MLITMYPRENGTVLDPCNDGECWTYCDHEKWYDMNFEDYEYTADRLKHEQYDCVETGCADFYYGNFNLEILEECVSAKCKNITRYHRSLKTMLNNTHTSFSYIQNIIRPKNKLYEYH